MNETTKAWVEYALRDLETAEYLLNNKRLANSVLFHCQQTVEKIIKAVLNEENIKIPRIHNVLSLFQFIPENKRNQFKVDENHLKLINDIYTDSRYPGDIGLLPDHFPVHEDAKEYFEITKNIFENINHLLNKRSIKLLKTKSK